MSISSISASYPAGGTPVLRGRTEHECALRVPASLKLSLLGKFPKSAASLRGDRAPASFACVEGILRGNDCRPTVMHRVDLFFSKLYSFDKILRQIWFQSLFQLESRFICYPYQGAHWKNQSTSDLHFVAAGTVQGRIQCFGRLTQQVKGGTNWSCRIGERALPFQVRDCIATWAEIGRASLTLGVSCTLADRCETVERQALVLRSVACVALYGSSTVA